ncbi:pteridine-dependent deoxygenase [Fulvimonas soli]|jgi:chorismate lyase/3-hydroxybenzoate synthase|uniref:Chorismate lyase/3-hydroxybenzoate synthase n=1 Tax=Fulvimonas soli TaxID=155197 RepID=A0A316IP97_9GAMM|nr:pteridine-dependent deoxygenase [Fulvimonas soli]PWK92358.1 chorismate lyase/3-hydroxybenzoate synthase [Fulvimonas soli]TNY25938.1 pteridine-dependent deoxygenase [Fulvimonas soli]
MVQAGENAPAPQLRPRAPRVSYRHGTAQAALGERGTLAVFGFGAGAAEADDPRWLGVPLEPFDTPAPLEIWQVDADVAHGRDGALRWACGGGWLYLALELDEREHGGPAGTARRAYARLRGFLARCPQQRVLRVWNYLGEINHGEGDAERYKQFCNGRAAGMGDLFADGYPAATAIGHHAGAHRLQVYLLACEQAGMPVENPRQLSAWRYPRQYGPTPPGFARAMGLPAGDALAISGTAAVVGHASAHAGDPRAQLGEILANLEALLANAGMPAGFDTHSPLKAYVRRPADAALVRELLQQRLPGVPVLLLHGDVCREELLVELDGWRYA